MTPLDDIKDAAIAHHLPWELVHAICEIESSLNPFAMRYEPNYKWLTADPAHLSPTERVGQMISWGPMQVMGAVARSYGFTGYFPALCTFPTGLTYGCLHLAHFHAKYSLWTDVIAAYNAGSPRRTPDGRQFVNQFYVDKVLRAWQAFEPQLDIKSSEA